MKLLIAIFLIGTSFCLADEIILKNGFKIMNVQFIDSTSEYVTVITKARERKIPTKNVIQVIKKRFDLSYDSMTDTISSTVEYPPQNIMSTEQNGIQTQKELQTSSVSTYDKIIFVDGKKAEGKISSIKTDVVVLEDAETGISFEYRKSEINRIITAAGKVLSFNQQNNNSFNSKPIQQQFLVSESFVKRTYFKPFAGVAIPISDYASTEASNSKSGFAKTGYGIGAEIISDIQPNTQFQISALYFANAVDGSINSGTNVSIGSYHGFNLLGGFRFITSQFNNQPRFHIGARIGLFVGSYPTIEAGNISITSNTSSAFAYNFTGGILLNDKIDLSVQYLGMTPKYDVSNSVNDNTLEYEQPTNLILISLGIYISE